MDFVYYFIGVFLIWSLCLLSVLLHESGHALGHRISTGKARWKIIAGCGPVMINTKRITVCLIPAGGCFIPEEDEKTKKAKVLMLAGGPVLSLLQVVLYGVIRFGVMDMVRSGSSLYESLIQISTFLLCFNFFQFFLTVIPIRYRIICRGFESDGLQIVRTLKREEG